MAPVWVWIFLDEVPSSYTFIGGSIIVATLVANSLYTLRKDISLVTKEKEFQC
jgi:drug/metabolite transporter (DMT)-like permease